MRRSTLVYLGVNVIGALTFLFFVHRIYSEIKSEQREYDFLDFLAFSQTVFFVMIPCGIYSLVWFIKSVWDIFRRRDFQAFIALIAITVPWLTVLAIEHEMNTGVRVYASATYVSPLRKTSWKTKAALAPNTYILDICPIKDGRVERGLFHGEVDWAKDPEGQFAFVARPENGRYKISISSKANGTCSVSTEMPIFKYVETPSLPATVGEGTYILLGDLENLQVYGEEEARRISTYKHGFVLRVTKR